MVKLEQLLRDFTLSEASRQYIINEGLEAPKEFEPIAKAVLAGHFCVKGQRGNIIVRPTCIEFYYHEELDNGIKDYIVYHKNTKNAPKLAFKLGTLHNHVSGVDITFEKGTDPSTAIRASLLIREFEIDGRNDDRSTALYEALYQQTSIFDGISVKWIDGDETVETVTGYRKNVAQYETPNKKKEASLYPDLTATENKKYVQDLRKWQFRRK